MSGQIEAISSPIACVAFNPFPEQSVTTDSPGWIDPSRINAAVAAEAVADV